MNILSRQSYRGLNQHSENKMDASINLRHKTVYTLQLAVQLLHIPATVLTIKTLNYTYSTFKKKYWDACLELMASNSQSAEPTMELAHSAAKRTSNVLGKLCGHSFVVAPVCSKAAFIPVDYHVFHHCMFARNSGNVSLHLQFKLCLKKEE